MRTGMTKIRAVARQYPNVTVYDYSTGISWHVTLFSFGAHADGYPVDRRGHREDVFRRSRNQITWTPKPVWVAFSKRQRIYGHDARRTAHGTNPISNEQFRRPPVHPLPAHRRGGRGHRPVCDLASKGDRSGVDGDGRDDHAIEVFRLNLIYSSSNGSGMRLLSCSQSLSK